MGCSDCSASLQVQGCCLVSAACQASCLVSVVCLVLVVSPAWCPVSEVSPGWQVTVPVSVVPMVGGTGAGGSGSLSLLSSGAGTPAAAAAAAKAAKYGKYLRGQGDPHPLHYPGDASVGLGVPPGRWLCPGDHSWWIFMGKHPGAGCAQPGSQLLCLGSPLSPASVPPQVSAGRDATGVSWG